MKMRFEHLPSDIARHRVLNTAQSAGFCNISVSHWRRLYRNGRVPPPIQLSTRKLGWRIGDLVDWLASRVREST
jgi:predicted DNA-binding transcriptional regulator AlpA